LSFALVEHMSGNDRARPRRALARLDLFGDSGTMPAALDPVEPTKLFRVSGARETARTVQFVVESPVGALVLNEADGALAAITWRRADANADSTVSPLLATAARQLDEYFAGWRRSFELPLAPKGSPFQQRVWAEMCRIPFGATARYGDLARALGTAAQPIGQACGANPIPIVIPCHRIVAAGGLGGFSGGAGLTSKRFLLRHEGALAELDL
jgi:methylated-DNA-[protein]-cysteine S-methyltransferase